LESLPRHVLDSLLEGCQVIGFDWKYLYVNDAAAKQGRRLREEFLGRTMTEAYPGIENTEMFAVLRRCMEERTAHSLENEFTFPDGSTGWFEVSIEPVPEGVCVLSAEITERKRAEARIVHLNAVLHGIRNVNQLITRERDPELLIQRACDLLVESRGFETCCIVLCDGDQVKRVADAGNQAKLKALRHMLSRGDLPECVRRTLNETDLVVRQNPVEACPDCPVNADFAVDRDTVAIRLTNEGKVFGALLVSVPARMAADPEELDLLREVAGDVAFALRGIELGMQHKRAEEALRSSDVRHRILFERSSDALMTLAPPSWAFTSGNPVTIALFGARDEADFVTRAPWQYSPERQPDGRASAEKAKEMIETAMREGSHSFEWTHRRLSGEEFPANVLFTRMEMDGQPFLHATVRDITERKRAELEREKFEAQLRGSQKMEAIGRLAGGVAHDFNNLLSVIISYAGFARDSVRESDPLHADILQILKAAERAASLTRQLLAFGRKQLLQPQVLDLNKVVGDMEGMLRRLLGEDVELAIAFAPDLGVTLADPGQIEQVVMNLAVNARDAMPGGGKLTIDTANVELDEAYASQHVATKPGSYVALSVTDTGCGMDEKTQARLFEPFFTTKEPGKGTGLGLATVYGIVKQSGGNIWVYSEPGKGTTFKVYLPWELGGVIVESRPSRAVTPAGGHETILVVEDEEVVRKLARRILVSAGYMVLTAANGGEAILTCEQYRGPIHLMLTDVVMPKMSGKELGDRLAKVRPDLRVLYMSGYTDNAIVHHGVLDPGTRFVGKPFNAADLTRAVREALDEPVRREHG
jgi:PAS domain S-box-containing protein